MFEYLALTPKSYPHGNVSVMAETAKDAARQIADMKLNVECLVVPADSVPAYISLESYRLFVGVIPHMRNAELMMNLIDAMISDNVRNALRVEKLRGE